MAEADKRVAVVVGLLGWEGGPVPPDHARPDGTFEWFWEGHGWALGYAPRDPRPEEGLSLYNLWHRGGGDPLPVLVLATGTAEGVLATLLALLDPLYGDEPEDEDDADQSGWPAAEEYDDGEWS